MIDGIYVSYPFNHLVTHSYILWVEGTQNNLCMLQKDIFNIVLKERE